MYVCCICNRYARKSYAEILRHIRAVHPHFSGAVICGIDNCPTTLTTYESLRQHIYRKHKRAIFQGDKSQSETSTDKECDGAETLLSSQDDGDDPAGSTLGQTQEYFGQHLKKNAAMYILKLREGRRLTQTAVDGVLKDTTVFLQNTVEDMQASVMRTLNSFSSITDDEKSQVEAIFTDNKRWNPFQGLESHYLQERYYQENFNYVVRNS